MAYPGYLLQIPNLRKKRLCLHSFGTFWTISTENQCEILQRNQSTAQTSNFSDFPLIFGGNGPKSTKTMQAQTQALFLRLESFSEATLK